MQPLSIIMSFVESVALAEKPKNIPFWACLIYVQHIITRQNQTEMSLKNAFIVCNEQNQVQDHRAIRFYRSQFSHRHQQHRNKSERKKHRECTNALQFTL